MHPCRLNMKLVTRGRPPTHGARVSEVAVALLSVAVAAAAADRGGALGRKQCSASCSMLALCYAVLCVMQFHALCYAHRS